MDALEHIKTATPYKDINEILYFLTQGIYNVFGSNLIGVYLTGSLSYGDFKEGRSDIDLAVVINQPATPKQIEELRQEIATLKFAHAQLRAQITTAGVSTAPRTESGSA